MRIFLTSLMAFFLSAFAGGLIAQTLAVETGATEEYILVFVATSGIAVVVTFVLFIAQFFGNGIKAVNITTVALIVLFGLMLAGLYAWSLSASPDHRVSHSDMSIFAGLILPNLAIIIVQWLFVRWRLGRRPGAETPRFGRGPEPA